MKIYISGLYSGTNPQPGVGIARSLRQAFPEAELIGVEYSNRCSGIHWHDFDDIWLQRPWDEINLAVHAGEIIKVLDAGAYWISSIDLEILWLASLFPESPHPNLLTPTLGALQQVGKPAIPAHEGLPVKIPPFVVTDISDWDLHAFCRENDWKVWLKGPYYDAVRTTCWGDFAYMRNVMSGAWATDKLFLQAHVSGYEESIALSAYKGELLDCVRMRKRDLTEIGKTWAGDISEVETETILALRKIIRTLGWTGGAELEMVRDADDRLWLLEWNPRYPAWIHGGTITGRNVPAALVEAATGVDAAPPSEGADEFTRVVLEIPVKTQYPLPPLPEPLGGRIGHSLKHPSGLLQFARELHKLDATDNNRHNDKGYLSAAIPKSFVDDLTGIDASALQTPASIFMKTTAAGNFARAGQLSDELSSSKLKVTSAYSIKTNPDERLIKLALDAGFFAEAISIPEVNAALSVGFKPDQIILNGPAKWWREETLEQASFYSIFCDSIDELKRVTGRVKNGEIKIECLGIRLRTPNIESRFGIPVNTPQAFQQLVDAITQMPAECRFGIHFHMASSNIGVGQWWHLFESMLRWCGSIEALAGKLVEVLDVGGGWFPEDMQSGDENKIRRAIAMVPDHLPNVVQIFSEPGKAMAQPSMALAVRILEIRKTPSGAREAVVDGSIAELPMYFFYPHRILSRDKRSGDWGALKRGNGRLLGRLCMEHDIVATDIELPAAAEIGDVLIFCDAGAYDRSMSYVFGRG